MQKQDTSNVLDDDATESISLTDVLVTIWSARWAIVVITMLLMAGGLSGSLLLANYKSQGFFQFGGAIPIPPDAKSSTDTEPKNKEPNIFILDKEPKDKKRAPGITLADYKRYAASYATNERFADFVQDKKLESDAGIVDLRNAFLSRDGISKMVEPVYLFTKLDAKQLIELPTESSSNVIGLQITYEGRTPGIAQQMVDLLGRYAIDSIIYMIYSDALQSKHSEIKAKMVKLDNVIISNKERLGEYRRRGEDLKRIVSRYPQAAHQGSRQVISVTDDSARYLSPVTLLATTEVQASEANEAILKAKREQTQAALFLEYYDRVKASLKETKSGETMLRGLEPLKESVFKSKNLENEAIREVFNTITIENQNAVNVYLENSRFIAGPTLPIRSSARASNALVASLMLGLFLSILFVFGRKWWRENQIKLSR